MAEINIHSQVVEGSGPPAAGVARESSATSTAIKEGVSRLAPIINAGVSAYYKGKKDRNLFKHVSGANSILSKLRAGNATNSERGAALTRYIEENVRNGSMTATTALRIRQNVTTKDLRLHTFRDGSQVLVDKDGGFWGIRAGGEVGDSINPANLPKEKEDGDATVAMKKIQEDATGNQKAFPATGEALDQIFSHLPKDKEGNPITAIHQEIGAESSSLNTDMRNFREFLADFNLEAIYGGARSIQQVEMRQTQNMETLKSFIRIIGGGFSKLTLSMMDNPDIPDGPSLAEMKQVMRSFRVETLRILQANKHTAPSLGGKVDEEVNKLFSEIIENVDKAVNRSLTEKGSGTASVELSIQTQSSNFRKTLRSNEATSKLLDDFPELERVIASGDAIRVLESMTAMGLGQGVTGLTHTLINAVFSGTAKAMIMSNEKRLQSYLKAPGTAINDNHIKSMVESIFTPQSAFAMGGSLRSTVDKYVELLDALVQNGQIEQETLDSFVATANKHVKQMDKLREESPGFWDSVGKISNKMSEWAMGLWAPAAPPAPKKEAPSNGS